MRFLLIIPAIFLGLWALVAAVAVVEAAIIIGSVAVAVVVCVMIWRFFTVPAGQ